MSAPSHCYERPQSFLCTPPVISMRPAFITEEGRFRSVEGFRMGEEEPEQPAAKVHEFKIEIRHADMEQSMQVRAGVREGWVVCVCAVALFFVMVGLLRGVRRVVAIGGAWEGRAAGAVV